MPFFTNKMEWSTNKGLNGWLMCMNLWWYKNVMELLVSILVMLFFFWGWYKLPAHQSSMHWLTILQNQTN